MLILPLHKKPTRENFPYVTLALIVLNVAVFVFFQSGDRAIEERSAKNYIDQDVLALEWSWFLDWSEYRHDVQPDPSTIDQWLAPPGVQAQADLLRFQLIESQPEFVESVEQGVFAPPDSEAFQRWQSARLQLEADRQDSFTRRYMLRYDGIDAVTALTHMFMHGSIAHLIGNMLFLALLGLLVERAIGRVRFLVFYLLSGLGAVALSLALNWGHPGGGIGASGAIAGLMGLFAVIYGRRKVRFFYWALVYFDYVRAPALILLPVWLGWEILSYVIDTGSNVAYEAHIGGMIGGACLGLVAVRMGKVQQSFVNADNRLEDERRAVEDAKTSLNQLDAPSAKKILRPLLKSHPEEPKLWRLYFAACRLGRNDPELHATAARILHMSGRTPDERELIMRTFATYRKATRGKIRLKAGRATWLANKLALWGETDEARYLVDRLAALQRPVPGLAAAAHMLAEQLKRKPDQAASAKKYQELANALARDTH